MIELDGNLYFATGRYPAAVDGGTVCRVAPGGAVTVEYTLAEQGAHDMHLHAGKIYVAGTDPMGDWTLGNLYIRDAGGAWAQRRTLPLTIHTLALCHDDAGDLWAGVGAHSGDNATWQGRVMRSVDDGATWENNWYINDFRVWGIAQQAGAIWAVGQDGVLSVLEDGAWATVAGVSIYPYPRMIHHAGNLIALSPAQKLTRISAGGAMDALSITPVVDSSLFNVMTSDGSYLYILAADGYIWRSEDLSAWARYSRVPGAISLGHWPSQSCLVASSKGADAKLWRIEV